MEAVDREGLRRRVKDPFYQNTTSILAMENDQVLGRIEYHFYGCMQDGYRMAVCGLGLCAAGSQT
mgnify:CR=1 FL=1